MLLPEDCRTAKEAERVLIDACRNLSAADIVRIQRDAAPNESDSSLIAHAKHAQRRYYELLEGVVYHSAGLMHHPI